MRKFIRLLSLILTLSLLCGCNSGSFPSAGSSTRQHTGSADSATAVAKPTDQKNDVYQQLFDRNYKVELNLRMEETEIAKLQADYERYSAQGSKSPIYRMADLDVTITAPDGSSTVYTIDQVGVRMKGNTSRTSFYNEDEGIYNLIHFKISFQETFDKEEYYGTDALKWDSDESREARKDRTFATLEKMDLRWNKCNDGTYIREYYAFEAFRENGVLSPRTSLASVDWAGLHMGVFTLCEPVDKVFLKRNLPQQQQGGDLYKLGWTGHGADFTRIDSIGVENEDTGEFYVYDLKTNKKKSHHEDLKSFISALNSGHMTKEKFAELVDVDNFLRFAAVSYLLGNPDDLRSNYNNCYIYFPPEGGCLFIPTDYDRCLGVTHEWDPTGNAVTTDDPFGLTLNANGNHQKSPLYLYSICTGGYYVAEFAEKLQEAAAGKWFTDSQFEAVFAQAKAHYANLTTPGKNFHNSGDHQTTMTLDGSDGNMTFRNYLSAKLKTLKNALKNVDTNVVPQPSNVYIRAEFTNWDVWPEYAMLPTDDGKYCFTISGGKFKIYDKNTDRWYGSEVLTEDPLLSYQTDDHTNIILPQGRYLVTFDPETAVITIVST